MSTTRVAKDSSRLMSVHGAAIKKMMQERLELINFALTAKENPGQSELKIHVDESDASVVADIQKYLSVKPIGEETIVVTDSSQARQEFLDDTRDKFETFYNTLQIFIGKTIILFNTKEDANSNNDPDKKKEENKRNKENVKIIIGALFNSYDAVTDCKRVLANLQKEIKKNNIEMKLLQDLSDNVENVQDKMKHLESEKSNLEQAVDAQLDLLITSYSVKSKIRKLMFNPSDESHFECMRFLDNVRSCIKLFDHFRECLTMLDSAGFYNVNGRSVCFWSGDEAQKKANASLRSVTDSNVPAFSVFSLLALYFRKIKQRELSDILFLFVSAEFASKARGNVDILSSTSSRHESDFFTVDNFHWRIEQLVLLILQRLALVSEFLVFSYDQTNEVWPNTPKILYKDPMSYAKRRLSNPGFSPDTNRRIRIRDEKSGAKRQFLFFDPAEYSGSESSLELTPKSSMNSTPEEFPGSRRGSISILGDTLSIPLSPRVSPRSAEEQYRFITNAFKLPKSTSTLSAASNTMYSPESPRITVENESKITVLVDSTSRVDHTGVRLNSFNVNSSPVLPEIKPTLRTGANDNFSIPVIDLGMFGDSAQQKQVSTTSSTKKSDDKIKCPSCAIL